MRTYHHFNLFQRVLVWVASVLLAPGSAFAAQGIVTIDFEGVQAFRDFAVYSEKGFTLTPSIGKVRINDAFSPRDNAAQPSFGFGQGLDSGFTFSHSQHREFSVIRIDLLEATVFPEDFGVTVIGTRRDSTTVTQTFTLDGVAGRQTFVFHPAFTNLISLRLTEDAANHHSTDVVQIDNVWFGDDNGVAYNPPKEKTIRPRSGFYGQALVFTNEVAGVEPVVSAAGSPTRCYVSVYDASGKRIKRILSNPVGQFYTYLNPGDYTLVGTLPKQPFPSRNLSEYIPLNLVQTLIAEPIYITVHTNQFTPVELDYSPVLP